MASVVINGDTSGGITLSAPAVAGSNTQTLVAATGNITPLISGTAVTASGTSVDFTGIPSWAKRITVMFNGVSTNGTSNIQIQLGDSGGIETTGYLNAATISGAAVATINYTSGMAIEPANVNITASTVRHGSAKIELISGNTFVGTGTFCHSNSAFTSFFSGSKTLSDTLTQIRITTVNGTDTFDAGTINIMYEG